MWPPSTIATREKCTPAAEPREGVALQPQREVGLLGCRRPQHGRHTLRRVARAGRRAPDAGEKARVTKRAVSERAGGGGGIRTHGPCGRRFSRPLLSTAQPPLRETRHDRRVSSERGCRRALHVLLGKVFHLVEEGVRRLEVPVDRRETDVGHLVELLQARENHLADAR